MQNRGLRRHEHMFLHDSDGCVDVRNDHGRWCWCDCRLAWKAQAGAAMICGMRVTIRRGTQTDAVAAAELWLRARKQSLGTIPAPVHDDDDVHRWFGSHVVGDTELWIAEDAAGTPVGILVLDGEWVDQLYVEPAMTGQGIGAQLLSVAKRDRPGGLRLWTFASNTLAQRFYERHGFVETDRTDGRRNEERAPDILYTWPGTESAG